MQIPTVKIPADNARGFKILNADDPRATPSEDRITPETIAKMKKPDVVELLAAHGIEADGKVADLRAQLAQIMFLEA